MFEFAARRVDAGLLTPTVAVCYGGELDEMRALPGYTTLRDACGANNIEMFESVMSLTGMVNVGKGAVRSEEHTSELQSLMRISYAVFCLKKKKSRKMTNLNNVT